MRARRAAAPPHSRPEPGAGWRGWRGWSPYRDARGRAPFRGWPVRARRAAAPLHSRPETWQHAARLLRLSAVWGCSGPSTFSHIVRTLRTTAVGLGVSCAAVQVGDRPVQELGPVSNVRCGIGARFAQRKQMRRKLSCTEATSSGLWRARPRGRSPQAAQSVALWRPAPSLLPPTALVPPPARDDAPSPQACRPRKGRASRARLRQSAASAFMRSASSSIAPSTSVIGMRSGAHWARYAMSASAAWHCATASAMARSKVAATLLGYPAPRGAVLMRLEAFFA